MSENETFEGWAILELMGHRRLGGYVRQVEMFGAAMCRLDVPGPADGEVAATQFYGGSSIYCLTPTTEPMARAVALRNQPEPVQRWELPAPREEPARLEQRYCIGCNRYFRPERHGQVRCRECEDDLESEESRQDGGFCP